MTEESNKEKSSDDKINALTTADISKFLKDKVKNYACTCCGTAKWDVPDFEDFVIGFVAFRKDNSFSIPPPHVPVVPVICTNCGYTRTFSLTIISKWRFGEES
jgi:predicted nucleic-acid-binding Zn-ribbon protein